MFGQEAAEISSYSWPRLEPLQVCATSNPTGCPQKTAKASSLTYISHATTSHTTLPRKTTSKQNKTNTKKKKSTKPMLVLLLLADMNEINRSLCTFSICVLQYSTEQKGKFMLKVFSVSTVLFIRMKDWSEDTLSNAVLGPGLHTCFKVQGMLMTGLGCRLTNVMTSSPYSGRLMLMCLARAWTAASKSRSYFTQSKETDLGFGFMHCPG